MKLFSSIELFWVFVENDLFSSFDIPSFNSLENETLIVSDGTAIQICDWIDE